MGGVRLSNKFSYFYIFRDTFFGFGFLPFVFLLYFLRLVCQTCHCGGPFVRHLIPARSPGSMDPES